MRSRYLYLLVYLLGSCWGASGAQRNETCTTETCGQAPDPTSRFLRCVGSPSNGTGRDHLRRLKGMLEAAMDVYTFMRSSMTGVPLLSLQGALALNPEADPLQNEAVVQMWMDVKIKPLLKSITKRFLSCLSTKNFSCSTYQTVVRELSQHCSEMNPVQQKWIYTFFMYPFLSGDRVAGCVSRQESSEDWLMKNFGAFRVMARMKDFSALNVVFSGLEVLHLLSPAQKAELLLMPEVAGLDNGTLTLVFHSLLAGGPSPTAYPGGGHNWTTPGGGHNWVTPGGSHNWTTPGGGHNLTSHGGGHNWRSHGGGHNWTTPGGGHNWTTPGGGHNWTSHGGAPGHTSTYPPHLTYNPYSPPSPHNTLKQVVNGIATSFKPIGSFVHDFVSFTQERNISELRSTTLIQFLLNWTLAELADVYRPQNASSVPERPEFDVTNVEDWYQHVVMPVLGRFLPNDGAPMHRNVTLAFHQVFYLDHGVDDETSEIQDVCSITLDKSPCGLTDAVANMAGVLHCAALSNLTMSEETVMRLISELTGRLNSLMKELSTVDFRELASDFKQIFGEADSPSMTREHLEDPDFIKLWFQIKLAPLLPDVPTGLLSCLSTKNFSCPVFQTIVAAFSKHESNSNIYQDFIYPFLLNNNTSEPHCVSSTNQSAEWLIENFGVYSRVASIADFYKLNPNFSGLEVLHLLTPKQIAEMLVLPLPAPPEKDVVINRVFDFLLESPDDRELRQVLRFLLSLTDEVRPPCAVFNHIFQRLYGAIPILPPDLEAGVWVSIDELILGAPDECIPKNFTCLATQYNGTAICKGVNSSDLHSHLNTSMEVPCSFALETYACAQPENFTANQLASLLKCNLPGNSRQSRVLWKILLIRLSSVLDPALDVLADMSVTVVGTSASAVLDVIGEMRLSMLTDEQLRNSSVIRKWFSGRLRGFLPLASGRFLRCLSSRNLSCQSYQQILQQFILRFDNTTVNQQTAIVKDFIVPFLSQPNSGPGCVNVSDGSAEWLVKNLGPFSRFLSIRELLRLNPHFQPLEVLRLLTPAQSAELLLSTLPTSLDDDAIINAIIDHLADSPGEVKLREFLIYLVRFHQQGNLSCSSYRTLFTRLDLVTHTVSLDTASSIIYSKMELSEYIPPGCNIYGGECNITMTNETDICVGVNSTMLQLRLHSGRLCDFAVEEVACASLAALKAEDLAAMLACNRSSNSSGSRRVWKLLLSKASHVLDDALDLLANTTLDPRNPAVSLILDSIREIRLDAFGVVSLADPAFLHLWFKRRLGPFLPAVSPDFLSCLTTTGLNCSTYQRIVQILSQLQPRMTLARQISVYTHFMAVFLTRSNTTDPSCSSDTRNSGEWLQKNLGGFSVLVSFQDLRLLYSNFSAMEALAQLTVRQLAEVSATPGQLTSPAQVVALTNHVPNRSLTAFFDDYSPAIMGHENMTSPAVRSAFLQVAYDRANLSDHSVNDSVVSLWLHNRLHPLLVDLAPQNVAPFFRILAGRNCSIEQQGVGNLNSIISSLGEETQKEIHDHIVQSLRGPIPLHCYRDNQNQSFYAFLESSFMGFQFPNLTTFLSLMPHDRMHQLVNSMPPSALGDLLRRPGVVDDDATLCVIYDSYVQTPRFLEIESLPAGVRRPTLPCVWPMALRSSTRSEVNAWFDRRLPSYLGFLTERLISPGSTHNASCPAFQKLVSVLGDYNYTAADFRRVNVFNTIKDYLTSATEPRCYDPNNPELNSTAWFAEYIGPFMPFLTLEDLQMFGSPEVIQVFTVNPLNIAFLNQSSLPLNFTNYYTELVYLQDPDFNPLLLPLSYRCIAPGPAFVQLTSGESIIVLHNLTTICTDLDPQISAALAGNFGDDIDATDISALGNESTGMSTSQILTIQPQELLSSLNTLSSVMGWDQGQASAIVQSLMSSGALEINSMASLLMLGSLVMGVPAKTFGGISSSQLLTTSKNPVFLGHMAAAPTVVQEAFVTQLISTDSNSEAIIQNVPDQLATEIPRARLLGFSSSSSVIRRLNTKTWKRQQVELFFDVMAVESATTTLGSPNNLSSSVLQGFTCTGVRTVQKVQIKRLIRACRRRGRNRVVLVETQLTCMYNYIRGDSDATSFDLYPPDVLLYYDYSLVPQASCRFYFQQLASADFYVFSSVLNYKLAALFVNARSCLGITTTSLTKDNILVLGNMCCTLDGSYIENSDPSILDVLGICPDLSGSQADAVEALLQSGRTQFGAPSTWNEQTLRDLGMIPLYLSSTFYENFNKKTKRRFLRYFLRVIRGVGRQKRRRLRRAIRKSIRKRSRRSTVSECTVGNITQVTISDETFPFDYDDITQFNCCLSASTVKDNLDAITQKVDLEEYLQIVLSKLREAYAATSTIPEYQVQLLGPASRLATIDDINAWTITQIDTLSALMDSSNGPWDPSLARAVITKYLSFDGNTLGSAELNAIGGANLCSLDVDVLKNISRQSLKEADALTVSNCTTEKKKELFLIGKDAFATTTRTTAVPVSEFQLIEPLLGGATSEYVKRLSVSGINMNLATFTSLDESVLLNLTVSEVQGLLGTNLPELKSYENDTLVQDWISRQTQTELNTLRVGLVGGRADATTTAPPTTATTTPNTATTIPNTATTTPNTATTTPNTATTTPNTATPTPNTATTTPNTATTTPNTATTTPNTATTTPNTATTTPNTATTTPNTATTSPNTVTTTPITATTTPNTATTTPNIATTPNTATTTPKTPTTTTTTTTASPTTNTTGSNGCRLQADAGFSFLALLALLIASLG